MLLKADITEGKKQNKSVEEGREVSEDRANPGQGCEGSVKGRPARLLATSDFPLDYKHQEGWGCICFAYHQCRNNAWHI